MKQQESYTTKREKAPPARGKRGGIFNLLMVEAVNLRIWGAGWSWEWDGGVLL